MRFSFKKMPVEKYHALAVTLLKFFLPWALAAFYVISILLIFRERSGEFLGYMGAYFAPLLGRGSVIPVAVARGFDPTLVALYITAMDVVVALFFVWNLDLITRLPVVGPAFGKLTSMGSAMLEKRPWVSRLAFTGPLVYMILPVQPGGSITATILGRLIGLKAEKIILAITAGAALSAFAYAYATTGLVAAFRANAALGTAMVIVGGVAAYIVYKKIVKPWEDGEASNGTARV